ncbi:hypothetical protein POREN0001_1377 [Porphyromonas endodontalis ATCC 35406]|uniref:Uncharacterized protein n=1 Tax=Porphyromonas endodontalis (strain ATCC 35406 / DSM 24491 / JCM 8526 / CCUG 16442 / BCRC 14492 / NCTC 13058 / HG 370) TaxID=553175 RepID=C3J8D2_POREA|nr:hypothetical protein POREN0001_1377 [Porphyromonas endodontalis ATCC 35406]
MNKEPEGGEDMVSSSPFIRFLAKPSLWAEYTIFASAEPKNNGTE